MKMCMSSFLIIHIFSFFLFFFFFFDVFPPSKLLKVELQLRYFFIFQNKLGKGSVANVYKDMLNFPDKPQDFVLQALSMYSNIYFELTIL